MMVIAVAVAIVAMLAVFALHRLNQQRRRHRRSERRNRQARVNDWWSRLLKMRRQLRLPDHRDDKGGSQK